jgi:hypothetical protein
MLEIKGVLVFTLVASLSTREPTRLASASIAEALKVDTV